MSSPSPLLSPSKNDAVLVRDFTDADRAAFETFNRAWVEKYFVVEPIDAALFSNPRKMILDDGGRIFIAEAGGKAAGACALKTADADTFELSKMGVDDHHKGKGIAKRLTRHCIDTSRAMGKKRIIIFSNRILENAIRIYQSCGFTEIPLTDEDKEYYQRVNIKLELIL